MSYASYLVKKHFTQEQVNDLHEWALHDAQETFRDEQLAYWNDIPANDPPEPKMEWLRTWINAGFDGRWPNEAEWVVYSEEYKNCMRRALYKLDQLWDTYEAAIEDLHCEDPIGIENNVTETCLDAMKLP